MKLAATVHDPAETFSARARTGLPVPGALRTHLPRLAWLAAGGLAISIPLFYVFLFHGYQSDHVAHVRFIQRAIEYHSWPAHFLYQVAVYSVSGFSTDFDSLAAAALVLLSACVVAKAWLSYAALSHYSPPRSTAEFGGPARLSRETMLAIVTAGLLVCAPVPRPWEPNRIYLGQISPSIWHNPTCILCWPIVIALFFAAFEFLRSAQWQNLLAVGALSTMSVMAKPNYFLAFAPAFGLFALRRLGPSRLWILSQVVLLPTVAILAWQWMTSFDGPNAVRGERHVAWMPFAAWGIHSSSIVVSLLCSLAFPLSYVLIFRRAIQNREMVLLAWSVLGCALVWTLGFAEVSNRDGTPDMDFNFSWGAHLSIYLLFLVTAIDLVGQAPRAAVTGSREISAYLARLPWGIFGLHVASGILWIARQLLGKGFA